jgi:serine/threonine-protein kinase
VTKGDAGKSEGRHILPHLLPGGKAMLYTAAAALTDWEQTNIVAQSLETGERRMLIRGGADARYVSTGHLLYLKYGTLMAVGFDPERLELKGAPVAMLDNVMQAINPPSFADETGAGQFSVSEDGTLAFVEGGIFPTPRRDIVWVDRKGRATILPIEAAPYFAPQVSPDGKRIAFHSVRERIREYLIWVYDISRQTTTRVTLDGDHAWPIWSPDGKSLAFRAVVSSAFHLALMPSSGTATPELLTTSQYTVTPSSWSASAKALAFMETRNSVSQIWILPMEGDRKPKLFLQTPFSVTHADFSPDGRWITYVSSESGSQEVYVQPYPGPGEKIRVSPNGGHSPAWAKNGRELFYQRGNSPLQTMAVDVETAKTFQSGQPHLLFEGFYGVNGPMRGYDVTPDGEHFVLTGRRAADVPEPPVKQMHIVLNWTEELKRRVPVK